MAGLNLWNSDEELSKYAKDLSLSEEELNKARQLSENAKAFSKQILKQGKEKEIKEASALLRQIDKISARAQTCFKANVELLSIYQVFRMSAAASFQREHDDATRSGNVKALRALQRVQTRWNNKKAFIGDSDRRTLEILEMLRSEAREVAAAKGGAPAVYWEAATSGKRVLSDEVWQGRLTAREIQARLVDAPGDRYAKEVRRLTRKLGIRLDKDERGRKPKPYLPKRKQKKPPGRPRAKPDLCFTDIEQAIAELERKKRGKAPEASKNQFWDSIEARRTAAQKLKARKAAVGK